MSPRFRSARWGSLVLAALAAGLLVGGSVGVLVGATTVPKITACVGSNGLMRYTTGTTCRTGERRVQWNVAGVTGPKGTTGAVGPRGAPGPPGAPGAGGAGPGQRGILFYASDQTPVALGQPQALFVVDSLKVPAGSYFLDVDVDIELVSGSVRANCDLRPLNRVYDGAGSEDFPFRIRYSAFRTFTQTTTIEVVCRTTLANGQASALIVATVAEQLPALP